MPQFKVRAWKLGPNTDDRTPMSEVEVENTAIDGKDAAFKYAYRHDIADYQWWNAGPKPVVVIRVSNMEDQDP